MGGFGERKRKRKKYNYIIILKNKEIIFKNLSFGLERLRALCSSNEPELGSQRPHQVALNPL